MSKEHLKRFNMRMGQELFDWYETQADRLGVPVSSFMIMVMNEYKKSQIAVDRLNQLAPHEIDIKQAIIKAQLAQKESAAFLDAEGRL